MIPMWTGVDAGCGSCPAYEFGLREVVVHTLSSSYQHLKVLMSDSTYHRLIEVIVCLAAVISVYEKFSYVF